MTTLFSRKRTSSLALAIALATGSAVVATAVIPAEASAQRNRDRKKDQESDGGGYSDAFRAAYPPLQAAIDDQASDIASMTAQFEALLPLLNTPDEKLGGGSLVYNAGVRAGSQPLQLAGLQNMLASGKVAPEQVGRYNFIAYQLANALKDMAAARSYLQGAIDANFSTPEIGRADLQIALAENYFASGEHQNGFDYLTNAIAARKANGEEVEERWYRRGVTVAYNEKVEPMIYDMLGLWLADFDSSANWLDAVNIARNLNSFADGEILDLFRLSRRVDALKEASDFDYYVDAADARRLPKEVSDVIKEGKAAGVITSQNLFITEALETAESRIAQDRADLPALERDAASANATVRTVSAAGDTFLSYGDYAKAKRFYEKALGMPGADTNETLTRLGIAQVGLGEYAAARETFGKVTGSRDPIARLWTIYATQRQAEAMPAPAAPAVSGS